MTVYVILIWETTTQTSEVGPVFYTLAAAEEYLANGLYKVYGTRMGRIQERVVL